MNDLSFHESPDKSQISYFLLFNYIDLVIPAAIPESDSLRLFNHAQSHQLAGDKGHTIWPGRSKPPNCRLARAARVVCAQPGTVVGPTKIRNEAKWSEMKRNEYEMKRNEDKMKRNESEWNKRNHIIVKWKWIKRNESEIKQIMVENEIEVWIPVYMSVCL